VQKKNSESAEGRSVGGGAASKRSSRVTLADVAGAAGVSVGAAGFVMSGRDDMRISQATQERVREAARRLNYRPNRSAQALRTGKSGTIAFISDTIGSTPFGGASIRGAMDVARERQKTLFVAETMDDPAVERDLFDNLATRDVDGLIYASMVTRETLLPDAIRETPTVLVNTMVAGSTMTAYVPDDRQGGFDAAQALIDCGHTRITVLGDLKPSLERPYALDMRLDGVRQALLGAGLATPEIIPIEGPEPQHGRSAMQSYLDDHPVPEALLAGNDRLAFGALQVLGERVRPGEDFSVVAFDNSDLATWLVPALASLQLPYYEMGRRAMESLLDGDLQAGTQLLPMPLMRRDSLCC
jgi:LacI family transcriptional regulator